MTQEEYEIFICHSRKDDVIADKIRVGMNIRDAMAYSLLTMDYEKDDYNTPRIAAVVTSTTDEDEYECYIGIVNDNKLLVEEIENSITETNEAILEEEQKEQEELERKQVELSTQKRIWTRFQKNSLAFT